MNEVLIPRKRWRQLEKKVADLEETVQSQQKEINSLKYPYEPLRKAFEKNAHRNSLEQRA